MMSTLNIRNRLSDMNEKAALSSMPITLRIFNCAGEVRSLSCDSVTLCAKDNAKGQFGGSIGIHRGHADALIALSNSPILAYSGGVVLAEIPVSNGFAFVSKNMVSVFSDSDEINI